MASDRQPLCSVARKARFFRKKYYLERATFAQQGEAEGGDFFVKTRRASAVQRSADLADLIGIACRIAGQIGEIER